MQTGHTPGHTPRDEGAFVPLDGRNRYRACLRAGVEPRYRDYEGDDPVGHVISMNIQRRHLNESQRGIIAARLANMPRGGDRRSEDFKAPIGALIQDKAAGLLNVGAGTVDRAKQVLRECPPDVVQQIERGERTVNSALRDLKQSKRRHLNESQRGMIAAELVDMPRGGDRGNQHTGGKPPIGGLPTDRAAELLTIGPRTVERAKQILRECSPGVVQQIERGERTVNSALRYRDYEGDDPCGFVVSANIRRRHLDESQRALIAAKLANMTRGSNQHAPIGATSNAQAARLANMPEGRSSKTPSIEGVSTGKAAGILNVSTRAAKHQLVRWQLEGRGGGRRPRPILA